MSDWTDWNERRTAPKPSYERPMPKFERKLEPKEEPIHVEESLMDTIRMKALNFIKPNRDV